MVSEYDTPTKSYIPTPPLYAVTAQIPRHNYFTLLSITRAHNELFPIDMTCYVVAELKQTGSQEKSLVSYKKKLTTAVSAMLIHITGHPTGPYPKNRYPARRKSGKEKTC